MNLHALRIFRERTQYIADLKVFKEYLESLFTHITNETVSVYWTDFLEIYKEMILIFTKLGLHDMNNYYYNSCLKDDLTEEFFKGIIVSIYRTVNLYLKEYENNIRKCSVCNENIFYLPINLEYQEMKKKYNRVKFNAETLNENEYICPVCGSLDRDRLIIAFLTQSKLLNSVDVSILQFAPSIPIEEHLLINYPNLRYSSADLYMKGVTYQIDIQDMHMISDNSYNIWICSHVLEHVADDKKALKELYRILKKNGIGLLLVPLDLNQQYTDEEIGCSEDENWRRFGQGDHVRQYAKNDFIKRITESGFILECLGREFFGNKLYLDNGLTKTSTLYVVRKE